MAQYIDKASVVGEIKKRIEYYQVKNQKWGVAGYAGRVAEGKEILDYISTLDVKEVDSEKKLSYEDYKGFFEKYPDLSDDWGFDEAWIFANYFFELGLKVQKGK